MQPTNDYWFRRKRLGWALEPGSPEGWAATVVFFVVEVGRIALLMPHFARTLPWVFIAWGVVWAAAFLALTLAKGERFLLQ